MPAYLSKKEAIEKEIIEIIGKHNIDRYNIPAIAELLIKKDSPRIDHRYQLDTSQDFWEVVANNTM